MKRAALILAALAAIMTAAAAPVRTATENFVTKKIAEAVAATTNVVCSIVTNEVQSFGDWVEEWDPPYYGTVYSFSGPYYEGGETWSGFYHPKKGMGVDMSFTAAGGEFATRLVFVGDAGGTSFTVTLTRSHVAKNALGLARMSDIAAHTDRTDNPHGVTAAQVGAYTKVQTDGAISAATNAMEAVGTGHQIVRGSFNHDENAWNMTVSYANSANEAGRAGSANYADGVPWSGIEDTPTSLSGYGITDAVPSSRTVNGKPLTSDITLSASDLGAATADGLVSAITNVVHGDYSDADRAAFPNGLGLKAGDGTDKGYVGLRLRGFGSHGLEVVGTRVTSTTAAPYTLFQLTDSGIRFPKAGLGDSVQGSDFTFLYWDAFSRANHVQDSMPSSGTANYEGYPISGKAFNEYFWGLSDLPAKAKASVTVHAASNLVGTTGAPVGVSDIIGSAVKESVLAVTSDVPVYAYSSAWTSNWPIDDSAQPSQPQWADGTWSVYLVEGGQTLPGAYSVEGPEDATTLTIDIAGFPTVFTRESTVSGYVNAHGLARISDISASNPAFSNAVLAVGLNIDTNSVAVLNEIASTFGGFPIEGTATTVGGLLAALAAAIAWLRRNKADKTALDELAAKVDAANAVLEEVA